MHLPLLILLPLLAWTVWRHKGKDSTNLKQHGNWPFPPDHLGYCSLAHRCLFQIFPLFFHGQFDVIYATASPISRLIGADHFHQLIFDTVSLAHKHLFQNWLFFNCIDLDVIKNIIKIISSDNQGNYFILKSSLFVSFQHLPVYIFLSNILNVIILNLLYNK